MSMSPRQRSLEPLDRVFAITAAVQRSKRDQLQTLPQFRTSRITNFTQTQDRTLTASNRMALALSIPVNAGTPDAPTVVDAPPASAGAYSTAPGGYSPNRTHTNYP